jgi:HSP20 family protein
MNRLFSRWNGPEEGGAPFPAFNVWEEGENVFVEAELPGVERNDVEIYVTGGNQFTVKGQRRPVVPERAVRHRQEREHGTFARTLTLPFPVDSEKVDAQLENGILRVKLAKHESAKPRKIKVKAE